MIRPILILVMILAVPMSGAARDIRYDAEQMLLIEQHGDEWKVQDADLDERLAALEKKYGKRPNIIHVMWDDQSLGEVGIPELNKVRATSSRVIFTARASTTPTSRCTTSSRS